MPYAHSLEHENVTYTPVSYMYTSLILRLGSVCYIGKVRAYPKGWLAWYDLFGTTF